MQPWLQRKLTRTPKRRYPSDQSTGRRWHRNGKAWGKHEGMKIVRRKLINRLIVEQSKILLTVFVWCITFQWEALSNRYVSRMKLWCHLRTISHNSRTNWSCVDPAASLSCPHSYLFLLHVSDCFPLFLHVKQMDSVYFFCTLNGFFHEFTWTFTFPNIEMLHIRKMFFESCIYLIV